MQRATSSQRPSSNSQLPPKQQVAQPKLKPPEFKEDPDYNSLKDKLLADRNFSDIKTDKLYCLLTYLREYAQYKGRREEYDSAANARDLSLEVKKELNGRKVITDEARRMTAGLENSKSEFNEKWRQKFEQYDEDTIQKRNALYEKHNAEFEAFNSLWADEMPRKYRKPSTRYLQLRRVEKGLAATGDYSKAKKIHLEAANLAQKEAEAAQQQLVFDFEIAERKFKQRQKQEIANFEESRQHGRRVLESQQESESISLVNRTKVVRTKASSIKPRIPQFKSAPSSYGVTSYSSNDDFLLPPLIAPNNPEFKQKEMKKKKEIAKIKQEYQKKNAEEVVAKYSLEAAPLRAAISKDEEEIIQNKQGMKVVDRPPNPAETVQSVAYVDSEASTSFE